MDYSAANYTQLGSAVWVVKGVFRSVSCPRLEIATRCDSLSAGDLSVGIPACSVSPPAVSRLVDAGLVGF